MNLYKTIKYKNHNINIFHDEDAQSPKDWGDKNLFLIAYHREFDVRNDDIITHDELSEWFEGNKIKQQKTYHIFPLTAYIHSGVSLSLCNTKWPFNDQWDSCTIGAVLASKKEFETKNKARQASLNLIEEWNQYISGEVFGYVIDEDGDSCWGFYGDPEEYLLQEAKDIIDYTIDQTIKKHNKTVKAYIKNNVPISKRKALIT